MVSLLHLQPTSPEHAYSLRNVQNHCRSPITRNSDSWYCSMPKCTYASSDPPPAGMCGGAGGSCAGELCRDRKYANSCCQPIGGKRAVCRRQQQWYWQCVPANDAAV